MFKRTTILALVLVSALLAGSKTSVKTYTFSITDRAVAGNAQLKPGEYHLKLDGTQVVLTDKYGNRIDTTATVENSGRRFPDTVVFGSKADGANRILSIELGGSKSKVVFESTGQ
jgi:hypothetical protein